jgi:rod shape-determining protein MreC
MESFFSRFKNAIALIVILLAQAVLLATQVQRPTNLDHPDGHHIRLVRLWAQDLMSPFERLSSGSSHYLRSTWANYVDLRSVRRHNLELQQQVDQLRLERGALSQDVIEAQRLRALLDFKQRYIASTIVAQVIGSSGSANSQILVLDKGARDGLKPDMAVITPDGIVGKLRDVFPTTSQLLLISDASSGAGVVLESNHIRAVLHGTDQGAVVIDNLIPDDRIQPGEKVVTSGGDQVFPRGLPVGTIASIKPDTAHQPYLLITLHPAANLLRLDEVLVVTASSDRLDPQTQQEITADATIHAADLGAEKLPSLHPGQPPTAISGNPGATSVVAPPPAENAPGLMPKPKPTLHPDRYTPGDTPPASDLIPGGHNPQPSQTQPPPQ